MFKRRDFIWILCISTVGVTGFLVYLSRERGPSTREWSRLSTVMVQPTDETCVMRFGADRQSIVAALGEPETDDETFDGRRLSYASKGMYLIFNHDDRLRMIRLLSERFYGAPVRDFSGQFSKGVKIGDSLQIVRDAFGMPDVQFNGGEGFMMYSSLAATFNFRNGMLSEIVLLDPDESKK